MGETSVLVAGAGPTGLVLACALAGQGAAVRIVDRAPGPAATSRALVLHARSAQVLDRLGALGDLPQRAQPLRQIQVHTGGRAPVTLRTDALPQAAPLVVSQASIEAALRDRLADLGVAVEWDTAVTGAQPCGDGVTVALSRGGPVLSGWLAGCDGAHSTVRDLAGIGFPGAPLSERFALADVHADLPVSREGSSVWLHAGGMLLAFPLPDAPDLWRLIADLPPGPDLSPDEVTGALADLLPVRAGLSADLLGAVEWRSAFRVQRRVAATYRAGRLLLAGDAAHIHSPFGGQGMNTGIGDAENLAWRLAAVTLGHCGDALLDGYTTERRPYGARVAASTTLGTRLVLGSGAAARLVRERVLPAVLPVGRLPALQRQVLRTASQLGTAYRRGPALPWTARVGDPAGNLPCTTAAGQPIGLHAALRGHWALLNTSAAALPAPLARTAGGRLRELSCAGVRGAVLVRPDGHIAWRAAGHPQRGRR